MASLIESLPGQIKRLEEKVGPDSPYVKDLKEQLRAMKETQGMSARDVFLMAAYEFAPDPAVPPRKASARRRKTTGAS